MNEEPANTAPNMPCAPATEAAVLCCLIENPKRFLPRAVEAHIEADMFHIPHHNALWSIIAARNASTKPIDPSSLADSIRAAKDPRLTVDQFSDILLSEFSESAWDDYVGEIRDRFARRLTLEASKAAHNAPADQTLTEVRQALERASRAISGESEVKDAKSAVQEFLREFQTAYKNGSMPGTATGIEQLDTHTGGIRNGQFWVFGARTSRGKSVILLQIADHLLNQGKNVLIFSLELSAAEIIGRLVACRQRVSMSGITNPRTLVKRDFEKIEAGYESLVGQNLHICDIGDLTMEKILGHAQLVAEHAPPDVIIIDYLQLVSTPKSKNANREQEVATISRASKQLAKKMKCPVLAASQLNEDGRVRESRAIENDADAVFYLIHSGEGAAEQTHLLGWKLRNGRRNYSALVEMRSEYQYFSFLSDFSPHEKNGKK